MQLLKGHVSPETAYVVNDYPYGFNARCTIRYWLDYTPKRGFRLCSQTTNPKNGRWNKPKISTYSRFGGAMYLDDKSHVTWSGLTEYCTGAEAQAWLTTYGDAVPEVGRILLNKFVAAKVAYDNNRQDGDPLHVGLQEARKAFIES